MVNPAPRPTYPPTPSAFACVPPSAVAQVTLVGPCLKFTTAAVVAVTGASVPVTVNGDPVPQWTALAVPAGATLQLGTTLGGSRAYVAVAGAVQSSMLASGAGAAYCDRRLVASALRRVRRCATHVPRVRCVFGVPCAVRPGAMCVSGTQAASTSLCTSTVGPRSLAGPWGVTRAGPCVPATCCPLSVWTRASKRCAHALGLWREAGNGGGGGVKFACCRALGCVGLQLSVRVVC